MRRVTSPAFVLLLAICTFFIDSANHTVNAGNNYSQTAAISNPGAADGGNFVIRYSPVLGLNVAVVVTIDGQVAGAITKGISSENTYLPPGRHLISVSRNGRYYDELGMILDVRPGRTYSYIAKYNVNQMLLVPVGGFR